ncbi:hypothetical protein EK21DRAFT_112593 [Setomelanomma holmii]|uniref:Uncharacterized protein n=1 Tax=Setomelanomma holmii TaxID=210430 RepID=A0A9P4H9V3_9PLEO|nr:hypothetical protein EK21DRAFT_112593 [Setomelanomma holmii]
MEPHAFAPGASPNTWSLKALIRVFYTIWLAAVDNLAYPPVKHFIKVSQSPATWFYEYDVTAKAALGNTMPAASRNMWPHFQQKYLCEAFYLVFYDSLAAKVQELFGAKVRWFRFILRPNLLFTDDLGDFRTCAHAALEITTSSGAKFVFDGIFLQFDWAEDSWFLSWAKVKADHIMKGEDEEICYVGEPEIKWIRAREKHHQSKFHGQFWKIIAKRVNKLVKELD